MKKLLALVLALIMSMFSTAIPAGAETLDTPETTKTYEWAVGYAHRCGSYKIRKYVAAKKMYNKQIRQMTYKHYSSKIKKAARFVACAPIMLLMGTAIADGQIEYYNKETFTKGYITYTNDEKYFERESRRIANAKASKELGHPAKESAKIICEGITAAQNLMDGHEPGELGGKYLYEAMLERYTKLDNLKKELDAVKKAREESPEDPDLFAKKRALEKDRQEIKGELKTLRSAEYELKKEMTETELALYKAESDAAISRAREKHEKVKVGRQVTVVPKAMLKGYKLLTFDETQWMKPFNSIVKEINNCVSKCVKLEYAECFDDDNESLDDKKTKAKADLKKAFANGQKAVNEYKNSGKFIELDARRGKVNNARQSQLADICLVPYGKTTDKIITLNHNIANVFTPYLREYLADTTKEADEMIEEFMESVIDVATTNGFMMTTLPSGNGVSRRIHYNFWNSNNTQLKIGKCVALSDGAYARAKEVGQAGMTDLEFEEVNTNGSDMLKWWSYATTPGTVLTYKDEPITVNDVLVIKPIEMIRTFKKVLVFDEDGNKTMMPTHKIKRTIFDGMLLFMVPIPSQQIRGGFCFKGFGLNCAYEDGSLMIDEYARRKGLTLPEHIEDIDGVMRRWRDYKVICTADAWKWAGWKLGTEKRQFTYAEYCKRMNALSAKYPTANKLYTARIADATEESKRMMTRQSTQQFFPADDEDISNLTAKSIRKIKNLSTHAGVIRLMAGLNKPEEERTDFEHLVEVCPEILNHKFMRKAVEDMFNRKVAEAAIKPEVDGIYPYIAEDPIAFFDIVFFGADPNKRCSVGLLDGNHVNIPNEDEDVELYLVRYPNNFMCGLVRKNHNDDIYRCVGNVMILPMDGGILTIADGDTDGDEMCVVKSPVVIKMMREARELILPPIISFPHDGLQKTIIRGKDRAHALSHAIVVANKYGPEVGKNSNLATKFFHKASVNYEMFKKTGESKYEWIMRKQLENAMIAHIAAIIAIDLAKTGKMPEWLEKQLNEVSKYAGKEMPWNQRFRKDSKAKPWFSKDWDEETQPETDAVVDRIARYVINATNAENYKAPTGEGFDVERDLLCDKIGLDITGSKAKLNEKQFRSLDARNYRTKDTNSEGDDEFKLINDMRSKDPNVKISPIQLARFMWRNQASLVYVLQKSGSDKLDNARMQNAYYTFCHEILSTFGSYCGNERFMKKSPELQIKSNVYKFVSTAFSDKSGIGCNVSEEEAFSKRASFCLFIVKVFAYDLYLMACEKKGIEPSYEKPQEDESEDNANVTEDEFFENEEGYSMWGCSEEI